MRFLSSTVKIYRREAETYILSERQRHEATAFSSDRQNAQRQQSMSRNVPSSLFLLLFISLER